MKSGALFTLLLLTFVSMKIVIVDFSSNTSLQNWRIVDDVVMGGRSSGNFRINNLGHGEFFGRVSTANNGGFSSVRFQFKKLEIENFQYVFLRVKGDNKTYQFRIKDKVNQYYSYTATFTTKKDWETIKIPLREMAPTYRGKQLNYPNFNKNTMEEIAILIGNKRNENFQLEIDKIYLE